MKRPQALIALCLIAILMTGAVPTDPQSGPVVKLARGLVNILTSPLEFPVQYLTLRGEQNMPVALLGTVINGTIFMVGRIIAGAVEVVTFPIPIPKYYAPILDPPTALDSMKQINGAE